MVKKKLYSHVFMAFGKTRETRETKQEILKGVGAVNILAVNPTRAEQNSILKNDASLEPINYVDTTTVKDASGNDVEVPRVRITLIVKTDPKIACNNGIEKTVFVSIFIAKGHLYSNKRGVTKVQVIDRFGRTAWVTSEELKEHAIPMLDITKGKHAGTRRPANLDKQYRPAFIGEAELIDHLVKFLNFPRPDSWDRENEVWVMKTNEAELRDSEAFIDENDFNAIFKGDVSVIRDAFMGAPKNAYKLGFGVRTDREGTLRQAVYTRLPMSLATTNYKDFETALIADAAANPPRHPDTIYEAKSLSIYTATPTDYSTAPALPPESEAPAPGLPPEDLPPDTPPFDTL